MFSKLKIYLYIGISIVILGMGISIKVLWNKYQKQIIETARWERNYTSETKKIEIYKYNDSINAVKAQGRELRINELEKSENSLYKKLSKLDIKVKDLEFVIESYSENTTQNSDTIKVPIYIDSLKNKIQKIEYTDKWTELKIEVKNQEILPGKLNLHITDSIAYAATPKYKKKCWLLFWKAKELEGVYIDAVNDNPNVEIKSINYIKIYK